MLKLFGDIDSLLCCLALVPSDLFSLCFLVYDSDDDEEEDDEHDDNDDDKDSLLLVLFSGCMGVFVEHKWFSLSMCVLRLL